MLSFQTCISFKTKVKRERERWKCIFRDCPWICAVRQCPGSPCPNPGVSLPAQLLLSAARGDGSVRVAGFSGRVAAAWPDTLGCGTLPSLWLPAIEKCSVFQVSLLALCILSQQLASGSGMLPVNGDTGCSCEYVTVAGTQSPQLRRVPLPGQAPCWGGLQVGGGPEELLPLHQGLPLASPHADLSAASGSLLKLRWPGGCRADFAGTSGQPGLPAPAGNALLCQTW